MLRGTTRSSDPPQVQAGRRDPCDDPCGCPGPGHGCRQGDDDDVRLHPERLVSRGVVRLRELLIELPPQSSSWSFTNPP